jgi:hypothetical protein
MLEIRRSARYDTKDTMHCARLGPRDWAAADKS